ncbi:MAG: multiheme c-type cytochrome [Acidobacteriota bacterium]
MTASTLRTTLVRLAGAVGMLLVAAPGIAQDDTSLTTLLGDEEPARVGDYVGLSSCANGACHGAVQPREGATIRGDEYVTRVLDPHHRAYEILSSRESREIAEALQPGTPATAMSLCLDCHAINVPASKDRGLFRDEGISCEGCHGPAGGWWNRHFEDGWSHQDSLDAGLVDLRSPAARAEQCLGCHQGEPAREVDHRLIAAGHPRLVFELDNYSSLAEIVHWLPDATRARRNGRRASHGLRAWAVGQAVGLREGVALLAHRADPATSSERPWPEFAEYSCESCHHVVGDGAWRRQPGYAFQGGLPPWSRAHWLVLRPLVADVAPDRLDSLDAQVDALADLVASMSRRAEVATTARTLANDLRPVVTALDRARWTTERARRLIDQLVAERERLLASDEASARQLAFSLQSLVAHLVRTDRRLLRDPMVDAVDDLFETLDRPGFDRATFAAELDDVAPSGE